MSEFISGAVCRKANVYVLGTLWRWLVTTGTSKCVCVGNFVEMVGDNRDKILQSEGQINE